MKHYRAAEQALPIIGFRPMRILGFDASGFANSRSAKKQDDRELPLQPGASRKSSGDRTAAGETVK